MTEEQQGGTPPEPEASASAAEPASANRAAAVAVADEPAMTEAAAEQPATAAEQPATATEIADEAGAAGGEPTAAGVATNGVGPDGSDVSAGPAASDVSAGTAAGTGPPAAVNGVASVSPDEAAAAPAAVDEDEPEPAAPRAPRPEPTTMEELLAEQDSDIKSFKHGDVVEGSVVRIDKDEMLVDIGAKSEGVVSNRELYGRNAEAQPQLNIGDTVLVYVLQPESQEGHVVLSLRRAGLERKWRSMQEQFEAGVIIEAPVIDHNKGGLIVDCGIRGFVPISQIVDFPRRPQNDQPRDAAQEIAEKLMPFVGRKLRLKILEVNRKANRLILSEKVALYEERREKRDELFSSLQVGQKVTGTVRSIAPFGVFIDLGGIDGLVHKSELSWNKVNNPEAGYKVGEEVEAEVIDINHERGRISLSIRRLQPDPWHSTVADFNVGDIIDGTVTKLVNFGAFVRVRDGLEGLIHISELSHQRVAHPGDVVHEGQALKLKIISLDSERHRLGLSLKQAEEPPARPAPEPGQPSQPRGERRPRQERSWTQSDAVQEPEGGIDNTLAAAFAQVRQQVAQSEEQARTRDVEPEAPATPTAAVRSEDQAGGGDDAASAAVAGGDDPASAPVAGGGDAQPAGAEGGVAEGGPLEAEPITAAEPTGPDSPGAESLTSDPAVLEPGASPTASDDAAAPVADEPTATDAPIEAPAADATGDGADRGPDHDAVTPPEAAAPAETPATTDHAAAADVPAVVPVEAGAASGEERTDPAV